MCVDSVCLKVAEPKFVNYISTIFIFILMSNISGLFGLKAGFHATKSDFVDAPLIDELAVAIECKLKDYDPDT